MGVQDFNALFEMVVSYFLASALNGLCINIDPDDACPKNPKKTTHLSVTAAEVKNSHSRELL
jgi:hypothetical protein